MGNSQRLDLNKLKSFIVENAKLCVHEPAGQLQHQYVTPTFSITPGADDNAEIPERSLTGHYLQMYDWDACFFSQAAYRASVSQITFAIISNFLSFQREDGYIPRTISPHRIWDQGDLCKPFLCQSLLAKYKRSPSSNLINQSIISSLDNYLLYFQKNRLHTSGLYHWKNILESGVDNNFALLAPCEADKDENKHIGDFPDNRLLATDLNSYLMAEFFALSELAMLLKNNHLADKYVKLAQDLSLAIDKYLWSKDFGIYCNLDPNTGEHIKIRTWTGLTPIIFSSSPSIHTQEIIEKVILNKDYFLRPTGIASVSAAQPLYNQAKRGLYGRATVSNWQGPMWILPNALIVRCLLKYDYKKQAEDIAHRVISTMLDGLTQTNTLFENYNAETGEALWAPQFMSWNILALELIELLES